MIVIDDNVQVVYTVTDMTTTTDNTQVGIKPHLSNKRAELIWALSEQGYADSEVGNIFNITKQRVLAIRRQMPDGWKSPWIKSK
jgi:hypothetical protein